MTDAPFRYRLHGLSVASDVRLPHARKDQDSAAPDLVIRRVDWAEPFGDYTFAIEGTASFAISGGREILFRPHDGAAAEDIVLFLGGSALAAALHQRGDLPLHAAALVIGDQAIAVFGESGAGKSTLAAWHDRTGGEVLSDDVAVVRLVDGRPIVWSGPARVRLWDDAAQAFALDPSTLDRAYPVEVGDKYVVGVKTGRECAPLAGLYLLCEGDDLAFEPLVGLEAVEALYHHTFRGGFLEEQPDLAVAHWQGCLDLVERVPVFRFVRPRDWDRLGEVGDALCDHARRTIPSDTI